MNSTITMYMKDNTGKVRVWSIEAIGNDIVIHHGQLGGSMQTKVEIINEGKGGRTTQDQVLSRIASRVSKQRDKGYSSDIESAFIRPTNSLGLPKPMLAKRYDQVANVDLKYSFVQHKYNGHRCIIGNVNGNIIAYSRNGKLITSIKHITDNIKLDEGEFIDGELYKHGISLQTISSLIKREQQNTANLDFIAYDMIKDVPYSERYLRLLSLTDAPHKPIPNIILARTKHISQIVSVKDELMNSIDKGYEGLIIRQGDNGYEDGKRSHSLIKVKKCFDDEFEIVFVHSSIDNWAILECVTNEGKSFRVSAPGTIKEKEYILNNYENYIGKYVTVEYFELTNNGTPFHPIAIAFRDKIEE